MNFSTLKSVSVPFRYEQNVSNGLSSYTATVSELDLIPENFGSRLADMAADYQKYRFTKLNVSILSPYVPIASGATTLSALSAVAFDPLPSSSTGAVSGLSPMSELTKYASMTAGTRCGFTLTRKELISKTSTKWFETTATGTPSDLLRYQGTIYHATFMPDGLITNSRSVLRVEGVCEFCVSVDPADSVALKKRLARDFERLQQLEHLQEEKDASSERSYHSVQVPAAVNTGSVAALLRRSAARQV